MSPIRIFVSSVQKEFAKERRALKDTIAEDPILCDLFEAFIFEDAPAKSRKPDELYIDEVDKADVYIGLFGNEYGAENSDGISSTEAEYNRAIEKSKTRLIYQKKLNGSTREKRMQTLIKKADSDVVRKKFASTDELVLQVRKSLADYAKEDGVISDEPYIERFSPDAILADLDDVLINEFVRKAKAGRNANLDEKNGIEKTLMQLRLLKENQLRNSAIFAFGKNPEQYLHSFTVNCMLFLGDKKKRPTLDDQSIQDNVLEQIEQSIKFVFRNIRHETGVRSKSMEVPTEYEIPESVIRESIVNAIAHRDYASSESIEVRIFSDRFEVYNPASKRKIPDLEDLKKGYSKVHNTTLADILYQAKYIEKFGTGIPDMIKACREAGLREPEFSFENGFTLTIWRKDDHTSTTQAPHKHHTSTTQVEKLLLIFKGEMTREQIQKKLKLKSRQNFVKVYLSPALDEGLIEMTIPDQPTNQNQKYRLTPKGEEVLVQKDTPNE